MSAQPTPGPWRRRGRGSPHIDIVSEAGGDDSPLATCHEAGCRGDLAERHAEALANARLIIAAREYKSARESLFAAIEHGDAEHRAWLKDKIDQHFAAADAKIGGAT